MHRRIVAALAGTAAALLVASPAAAAPTWTVVPSVDPVTTENQLTAVTARSASDAWAVGFYQGPARHNGRIMLAEHWDGTRWSQVNTSTSVPTRRSRNASRTSGTNTSHASGAPSSPCFGADSRSISGDSTRPIGRRT